MAERLVLAIDNSLDFLNLALGRDEELIEVRQARMERPSSEVLPTRVARLLGDHGFSTSDLSLLVVTLGPGSFTGIRVSLAFCKGLSYGLGIPLVGVPTPDVLAYPLSFLEGYYLAPLIDAKKGEVFFSLYTAHSGEVRLVDGFHSLKPDELRQRLRTPCLCFGTGITLCNDVLEDIEGAVRIEKGFQRIAGEALFQTGIARYALQERKEVQPIYGRRSEAEIKFNVALP